MHCSLLLFLLWQFLSYVLSMLGKHTHLWQLNNFNFFLCSILTNFFFTPCIFIKLNQLKINMWPLPCYTVNKYYHYKKYLFFFHPWWTQIFPLDGELEFCSFCTSEQSPEVLAFTSPCARLEVLQFAMCVISLSNDYILNKNSHL